MSKLNLRLEEQRRRNRERAQRSATSNQSIDLVQSNQSTNEPSTGASTWWLLPRAVALGISDGLCQGSLET